MYIAAGQVIYHVTGKTWDEFLMEKLFDPIGMNRTTTTNTGFNKNMNIAWPHLDGEPMGFINYDNVGPAASVNSSVTDLLKWVKEEENKVHEMREQYWKGRNDARKSSN